jgi:hypothetical protein
LAQGNAVMDAAIQQLFFLQQAQESHALHHQNANALREQFHISREQACQIVPLCTSCPQHFSEPTFGINP